MEKTPFAGLTALEPGESLLVDGGSFLKRNPQIIDLLLRIGAQSHRHDAHARVADPDTPPTVTSVPDGGALPAGATIGVCYTLVDDQGGETRPSPATTITTIAPVERPAYAPDVLVDYTAGALVVDQYSYVVTLVDDAGGETTPSPVATARREGGSPNARITISGLATMVTNSPGATGWRLFRAKGTGEFDLLSFGDATQDTFVDDGTQPADCSMQPPATNTTNANGSLVVNVPSAAVGSNSWRLYVALDGDFSRPSLYGPTRVGGDAGLDIIIGTIAVDAGSPPDVSTTIAGADRINPETDLIDFHWQGPVATAADLPADAQHGDVRLSLDDRTLHTFDTDLAGWVAIVGGAGGGGSGGAALSVGDGTTVVDGVNTLVIDGGVVSDLGAGAVDIVFAVNSSGWLTFGGDYYDTAWPWGSVVNHEGATYVATAAVPQGTAPGPAPAPWTPADFGVDSGAPLVPAEAPMTDGVDIAVHFDGNETGPQWVFGGSSQVRVFQIDVEAPGDLTVDYTGAGVDWRIYEANSAMAGARDWGATTTVNGPGTYFLLLQAPLASTLDATVRVTASAGAVITPPPDPSATNPWVAIGGSGTGTGGGGGGVPAPVQATSTPLANFLPDEQRSVTLALGSFFELFAIETDTPVRVRLYTTDANRLADEARVASQAPGVGDGVILDATLDAGVTSFTPPVAGYNADTSTSNDIYALVTSLDAQATDANLTFTTAALGGTQGEPGLEGPEGPQGPPGAPGETGTATGGPWVPLAMAAGWDDNNQVDAGTPPTRYFAPPAVSIDAHGMVRFRGRVYPTGDTSPARMFAAQIGKVYQPTYEAWLPLATDNTTGSWHARVTRDGWVEIVGDVAQGHEFSLEAIQYESGIGKTSVAEAKPISPWQADPLDPPLRYGDHFEGSLRITADQATSDTGIGMPDSELATWGRTPGVAWTYEVLDGPAAGQTGTLDPAMLAGGQVLSFTAFSPPLPATGNVKISFSADLSTPIG